MRTGSWKGKTPEERAELKRAYNRERSKRPEVKARHKIATAAYDARNREKIRAYHKKHHAENADAINANKRAYLKRNPEPHKRAVRNWTSKNLHKHCEYQHRRRAAILKSDSGDCSDRIALLRKRAFCHWCYDLMDKVHIDHVMPLSRGGAHAPENLVASCQACNSSKGAKTPKEWASMLNKEISSAGLIGRRRHALMPYAV